MSNFKLIKNLPTGKYDIDDNYKWSKEFIINIQRINLDGYEPFENDTFKIVPFTCDPDDCNCSISLKMNKTCSDEIYQYEQNHMHDINCITRFTNFYHKPTGICISWGKYVDYFEYINKDITYEDWSNIVQDCVKSILKETYTEPIIGYVLNGIVGFGDHNISEIEFIQKFNEFLKNNGWSFSNGERANLNNEYEYYECKNCGKDLTDKNGDKVNGYCYDCINTALE